MQREDYSWTAYSKWHHKHNKEQGINCKVVHIVNIWGGGGCMKLLNWFNELKNTRISVQ